MKKTLYNKRTYFWGILLGYWTFATLGLLSLETKGIEKGTVSPVHVVLFGVLILLFWRFAANRRKSRRPEVQAELQRKKAEKEKSEAIEIDKKRLELLNNEEVHVTRKRRGNAGKKVAVVGIVVGYSGLRMLSSLTKRYM